MINERIIGAILSGMIDATFESIYASNPPYWTNKFPFVGTIKPLPPADDWIAAAISTAPYVAGRLMKNRRLEEIGLGGSLYSLAMFIHHIIMRM